MALASTIELANFSARLSWCLVQREASTEPHWRAYPGGGPQYRSGFLSLTEGTEAKLSFK